MEIHVGHRYLVTGGSGFLGEALVGSLVSMGAIPVVIARNEGKIIMMKNQYPTMEYHFGDVSDYYQLANAMHGCTGVFHLAAFKHVTDAERSPRQVYKTNLVGSENVCELADEFDCEFVITTSTDKCAQIQGVYGASKYIVERMFWEWEMASRVCKYRVVRYGNVLYSTGSVLCKWKELIKEGRDITITDPEATRFFWTRGQAIDLIYDCLENAENAEPYCPNMKGCNIRLLAEAMIDKYANGKKITINEIGLQPSENKHEKIFKDGITSKQANQWTYEELLEIL
jgi:UDP-N-acetylglucosamine 4,6-dehydratase